MNKKVEYGPSYAMWLVTVYMEYTVNLTIPLQESTIYFIFKQRQACIVVGVGPYSTV